MKAAAGHGFQLCIPSKTPAQESWALCIYLGKYKSYEVPAEGLQESCSKPWVVQVSVFCIPMMSHADVADVSDAEESEEFKAIYGAKMTLEGYTKGS